MPPPTSTTIIVVTTIRNPPSPQLSTPLSTQPEIIACTSAHAAIDKACDLMGIKLVKVPMNKDTYEIDMNAVSRALTG